jgi:hypothetical protein
VLCAAVYTYVGIYLSPTALLIHDSYELFFELKMQTTDFEKSFSVITMN